MSNLRYVVAAALVAVLAGCGPDDLIEITDPVVPGQDCARALAILTTSYGVQWRR